MEIWNMTSEIFEAIVEYYKKDEDTAANCLLYLSKRLIDAHERWSAQNALEQMGRCPRCGAELVEVKSKVEHPEIEGNVCEDWLEMQCPNCGR